MPLISSRMLGKSLAGELSENFSIVYMSIRGAGCELVSYESVSELVFFSSGFSAVQGSRTT